MGCGVSDVVWGVRGWSVGCRVQCVGCGVQCVGCESVGWNACGVWCGMWLYVWCDVCGVCIV